MEKKDMLKLENQLCFPMYVCAKEIVRRYTPFLDKLGLTYTQYITMMVLWERKCITVKALGAYLFLDSGTLTPVLKKLEQKNYLTRKRDEADERILNVSITKEGEALKAKAKDIPTKIGACVPLSEEEAKQLFEITHKLLKLMREE